jgi:hypothetical protein
MALSMSRPWKHPKTGVYWLRKRIPDDLRPILGKLEEKRSLKTRDPAEAKRRLLEVLTELEIQWANLRTGPKSLTEREAHELALAIHDQWLEQYRDNPSEQVFWRLDLGERLWSPPLRIDWSVTDPKSFLASYDPDGLKIQAMEDWCLSTATECLATRGLVTDELSRLRVAKAIAAAVHRASDTLFQYSRGNFGGAGQGSRTASASKILAEVFSPEKPIRFDELVKGWAGEKRPAEKTLYEWKRVIRQPNRPPEGTRGTSA